VFGTFSFPPRRTRKSWMGRRCLACLPLPPNPVSVSLLRPCVLSVWQYWPLPYRPAVYALAAIKGSWSRDLGPEVYSASNRNEYHKQKNHVSGE
jgi:hypothetical protein